MKPICECCGAATGWGRAIRRKRDEPLLCGACVIEWVKR